MDGAFSNLLLHITFHWHKEWDNNRQSILVFMEMVHMGIKGIVTSRTTGKPIRGLFLLQYFFSIFSLLLLTYIIFYLIPLPSNFILTFSGALIHVQGIKHPVSTTKYGEYWKLLMPGTHLIHASFKDPKTGRTLRSGSKKVKIPEFEARQQKTTAIRFDFELWRFWI